MKIDPSARLRSTPTRRTGRARAPSAAGVFESHLAAPAEDGAPLAAPQAAASINPLLAVQEVADATSGRAHAKARGEAMLERLDDIRIGLLAGFVPRDRLEDLLRLVNDERSSAVGDRLGEVLDEIELRAKVELAKLSIEG
jgi:Class II flagellar assembly regulator